MTEDATAYIEYTTDKEGSVMGVTVTRQSMIQHCRALTMACHYTEGECTVCVLDFKREGEKLLKIVNFYLKIMTCHLKILTPF